MIAIVNVEPTSETEANNPGGERVYSLSINRNQICTFQHHRRDGLAECLRKAAVAVDKENGIPVTCVWEWDYDGFYRLSCGNMFQFTEDGIRENSFKFCPYCGKLIEECVEDE